MRKKLLAIIATLAVVMTMIPVTAFADGNVAKIGDVGYPTLSAAVEAANSMEGEATIELLQDVTVDSLLIISGNVKICGNKTISHADSYTGTMFKIDKEATLSCENITFDGKNPWTFYSDTTTVENGQPWYTRFVQVADINKGKVNANVIVNEGTLNLGERTVIKDFTIASDSDNGKTKNSESGGYYLMYNDDLALIRSNGGTVNANGVEITGNAGMVLNAVNAVSKIENATLDCNFGCGNKGGLFIFSGGSAGITNSSISNNKAMARSATVLGVINGADVTSNSCEIDGNKHIGVGSNTAGAIIVIEGDQNSKMNSKFTMNGGSISNNIGGRAGAIASRWVTSTDSLITLNSGTITGNATSNDSWNGASIFARSAVEINDGMVIDGLIVANASPAKITVNGGKFTGDLRSDNDMPVTVNRGEFNYDVTQYLNKKMTFIVKDNGNSKVYEPITDNDVDTAIKAGATYAELTEDGDVVICYDYNLGENNPKAVKIAHSITFNVISPITGELLYNESKTVSVKIGDTVAKAIEEQGYSDYAPSKQEGYSFVGWWIAEYTGIDGTKIDGLEYISEYDLDSELKEDVELFSGWEKAPVDANAVDKADTVDKADSVETGDSMNMTLFVVIAGLALAAMAAVVVTRRRQN